LIHVWEGKKERGITPRSSRACARKDETAQRKKDLSRYSSYDAGKKNSPARGEENKRGREETALPLLPDKKEGPTGTATLYDLAEKKKEKKERRGARSLLLREKKGGRGVSGEKTSLCP